MSEFARRFNVYGRIFLICRDGVAWSAYAASNEGKRSPAGFVIPNDVAEADLVQYLEDLFHESARPGRGDVHALED